MFQDEKFGFGGKKRKLKKNTSDSSSQDMGSFKPAVHSNKRFNKNTNKKVRSKHLLIGQSNLQQLLFPSHWKCLQSILNP